MLKAEEIAIYKLDKKILLDVVKSFDYDQKIDKSALLVFDLKGNLFKKQSIMRKKLIWQ